MFFTNVSSIQSGVRKKKDYSIFITMSNFRSISVPTSQRPSSSIGSGTRIPIPSHLLRCERCHHSDWITENDHCMSGGSPQSDCSWLSRDLYDSIFYSISPMVEACLCEGFMTSFFRALTAVVYFGMSLQPAPPDWINTYGFDQVLLFPPPLLEFGLHYGLISPSPSPVPGEKLLVHN